MKRTVLPLTCLTFIPHWVVERVWRSKARITEPLLSCGRLPIRPIWNKRDWKELEIIFECERLGLVENLVGSEQCRKRGQDKLFVCTALDYSFVNERHKKHSFALPK